MHQQFARKFLSECFAVSTFLAAVVGAAGSVLSAYIALKVRAVATISNGRLSALENEVKLTRLILDDVLRKVQ